MNAHLNDIASFDFSRFSPAGDEQQIVDEFDQLYDEGACRRPHDGDRAARTPSGHASRVRVLDRVLTRLLEREDVWCGCKEDTAQWVLDHPDAASWVDRDPAPISGLPGRNA